MALEQVKISTLTKQAQCFLAQGDGASIVLSHEGYKWYLGEATNTDGVDAAKAIIAPSAGTLQVLASLTPVFETGCGASPLEGELVLNTDASDRFPWVFGDDGTITAPDSRVAGVPFPAGGKVYIVWEGANVKWQWSGGIVEQVPPNALWTVTKVL